MLGLVLIEPALEEGDGGAEVIAQGDEQVDVVEILLARDQRSCRPQWRAFPVDAVAKRGVACALIGRPCCSLRAGHPKLAFRSF